ncbi:MAG: hypothetical protein WBR13_17025, partial [Allosphingosinicella sp.]
MRTPLLIAAGIAALSLAGPGFALAQLEKGKAASRPSKPSGGLTAFRSDSELRTYLRRLRRQDRMRVPEPVYAPMPA